MKLGIVAALLLAAPANAEIVEIPFSGSLSSAYGDSTLGKRSTARSPTIVRSMIKVRLIGDWLTSRSGWDRSNI